jgi:hypothetical protein
MYSSKTFFKKFLTNKMSIYYNKFKFSERKALMKKSTYYKHVRELMVGANQYGRNREWASELPNRTNSRLWRTVSSLQETRIELDALKRVAFATNEGGTTGPLVLY